MNIISQLPNSDFRTAWPCCSPTDAAYLLEVVTELALRGEVGSHAVGGAADHLLRMEQVAKVAR